MSGRSRRRNDPARRRAGIAVRAGLLLRATALTAWLAAVGTTMGTALVGCGEPTPPPNILLLIADDLGFSDIEAWGGNEARTPELDRLSRTGVRFTRFYTAGATCDPTRASILTGRYPQRFGFRLRPRGLPAEITTLPELLRETGYATHLVGKWHLGTGPASVRPNGQGFDSFYGFLDQKLLKPPTLGTYWHPRLVRDEGETEVTSGHLTEILTREAVTKIEQADRDRPWLLQVAFFAPHQPVQPPGEPIEIRPGDDRPRYLALVETLDTSIGKILDALEESGQAENTVVVFLSDNGAEDPRSNAPLLGGKTQLYEGGLRVPLIIRRPGEARPGTVDRVTSSMDLYPTIAALAGAQSSEPLDGVDLTSLLDEPSADLAPRTLFWEDRSYSVPRVRGVAPQPVSTNPPPGDHGGDYSILDDTGRWRYTSESGNAALLDLESDPTGSHNVLDEHPEVAERLIGLARDWFREIERIPVRIAAEGDASWDGEVGRLDGAGALTLSGWDTLRTPGWGAWVLSFGLTPDADSEPPWPLAHQEGVFSLWWEAGDRLRFEIGDTTLEGPVPAVGECTAITAGALYDRGISVVVLLVDGLAVGQAFGKRVRINKHLDEPIRIGAAPDAKGRTTHFRGVVRKPILLNSTVTPLATPRLAQEACGSAR